jgi:hypothetical protein
VRKCLKRFDKMPYINPSLVDSSVQVPFPMADSIDTYQISPEQERSFYEASSALKGQIIAQKRSREELLKVHSKNLKLLQNPKTTTKQLILPTAYRPSLSPLDALQKVCRELYITKSYIEVD